jgi:hypothetical protein
MTTSSPEPMRNDEISPPSGDDSIDSMDAIDEADIRPLKAYGFESEHQTLVGIDPVEPGDTNPGDTDPLHAYGYEADKFTLVGLGPPRPRKPPKPPEKHGQGSPQSEPPGPWGSSGNEVDVDVAVPVPSSIRRGSFGIWAAAVPLLLVLAAGVIIALRELAPSQHRNAASEALVVVDQVDDAGLLVRIAEKDVRVSLDGQDRGVAPVLVRGLKPGSHLLALSGPDYEPFEQPVTLVANSVSTVAPLLILRGSEPAAAATELRTEPVAVSELPSEDTKKGKTPKGKPEPNAKALIAAAVAAAPAPQDLAPTGKLSVSSNLPSNVVVDGRPLGKAPRSVDLAPGLHTVVFINAKEGRRSQLVNVLAGSETSASMEF